LTLTCRWGQNVTATIDGAPAPVARQGRSVVIQVPQGTHDLAFDS